jgi:hypothetical protein
MFNGKFVARSIIHRYCGCKIYYSEIIRLLYRLDDFILSHPHLGNDLLDAEIQRHDLKSGVATKLALEYTDKSFVTPVFNGSASLRNAAGQLIEEVAKGTRRHKTVDDAFIENLYGEMTSLYRLDGIGGGQSGRAELGELPATSVMLLGAIGAAWVFIGIYVLLGYLKKRKNQGNT